MLKKILYYLNYVAFLMLLCNIDFTLKTITFIVIPACILFGTLLCFIKQHSF